MVVLSIRLLSFLGLLGLCVSSSALPEIDVDARKSNETHAEQQQQQQQQQEETASSKEQPRKLSRAEIKERHLKKSWYGSYLDPKDAKDAKASSPYSTGKGTVVVYKGTSQSQPRPDIFVSTGSASASAVGSKGKGAVIPYFVGGKGNDIFWVAKGKGTTTTASPTYAKGKGVQAPYYNKGKGLFYKGKGIFYKGKGAGGYETYFHKGSKSRSKKDNIHVIFKTRPPTTAPTSTETPTTTAPTSAAPTNVPSERPTDVPTSVPTSTPTSVPTSIPTVPPTTTNSPSLAPTATAAPTTSSSPTTLTRLPTTTPAATTETPTPATTETPTTLQPTLGSQFNIQLINTGGDPDLDNLFESAARRWEEIIINDLSDQDTPPQGDWFRGRLSQSYSGPVDDVVIGYEYGPIDGPGGVVGRAGPIELRRNAERIALSAISGQMIFDSDDFGNFDPVSQELIILHEMGHVLGFGGTFGFRCPCFCECIAPSQVQYTCPGAQQAYNDLGFAGVLNLESEGGSGTECGHWENTPYEGLSWRELMLGSLSIGTETFISAITVASMGEIGEYEVNMAAAGVPGGGTGNLVVTEDLELDGLIEHPAPPPDDDEPPPPKKHMYHTAPNAKSGKRVFGQHVREFFGQFGRPSKGHENAPSPHDLPRTHPSGRGKSIKSYRRRRRG